MQITKYEHACLDIINKGSRLVIDPGVYTTSFKDFAGINVVVITHEHPDHYDNEKIKQILAANQNVVIFSTQSVVQAINDPRATAVSHNDIKTVGDIKLQFFGVDHAVISSAIAPIGNTGVLINDTLFYPGDALTEITAPYKMLAVPINAPWLKLSETIDYIAKSPAKTVFPTHNALLSENGKDVYYRYPTAFCQEQNKQFIILDHQPPYTIE